MLSIALDDAISQRTAGKLVLARQQVSVSCDLLGRLAASLAHACDSAARRGRHMPALPAVNPLNGSFFRGDTGRSAASRNQILHQVLFAERPRFFQKVKILADTIHRIAEEFLLAADDISDGLTTSPLVAWKELECLHDDFTTCLRETQVLLKGFLRALPVEQLSGFEAQLGTAPTPIRAHSKTRHRSRRASA